MEQTPPNNSSETQESIFDELELAKQGYDKHVRNARNAIFVVAGVQLVFGIITVLMSRENEDSLALIISLCIIVLIALVFLALGFWTKKKPYSAILIALIFYGILLLTDAIYEPTTIFKGILMKIFIIVYLVRGLNEARDAQRLREALGK
jgi:heme A synthase